MRAIAGVGIAFVLAATVYGQSAPAGPSFDIADVHVRTLSSNPSPSMAGGVLRNGRYDLRNATMLDMIRVAYDVDPETVLGGPNWLEMNRYDIVAKAPIGTSPESVRTMLQTLLADRFKLVLKKETRPFDVYVLTVGNGGKPMMT